MISTSQALDTQEWLRAHKIVDLFYLAGLLVFIFLRLLPGASGLDIINTFVLASILFFLALADLWTLHYRAQLFLTPALMPAINICFAFLGIWLDTPFAFMWVLASFSVLFMRMPLRSAYVISVSATIISANMLFFISDLELALVARSVLAGGMTIITLGLFSKAYLSVNRRLSNSSELLSATLKSISQGVSVLGKDNRYKLFNQQTCDLLNLPSSLLARNPTLPEVVQYQIDHDEFRDLGEVTSETRAYIFSLGVNVDQHIQRHYVRKDSKGRYIEVKTHPMPSGDVVRTYADVSNFENANRKLKELIDTQRETGQVVLRRVLQQVIDSMTALALTRDHETGLHIQRTKLYVKTLAQTMRPAKRYSELLSDEKIEKITAASPLHDLGKVGIPDHILLKPSRHTADETVIMRTHAMLGESILLATAGFDRGPTSLFNIAANIAGGHHENWDGSGYPRGLVGTDIPLEARLMALADVYDALTTERIYKQAWTHEAASAEIFRLAGKKFDPNIVAAFSQAEARFREIAIELNDATFVKSAPHGGDTASA